jgi:gluconate 2-dehydrogenase gamma chain
MDQRGEERISRRALLAASAAAVTASCARPVRASGQVAWAPDAGSPPHQVTPGPWTFFTPEEGATVEALVDRLIPPDPETPGGKDAGCAVFIDRQLAGPFGSSAGLWMRPPFHEGTSEQGPQSALTPAARYRQSLAALADYVRRAFAGKTYRSLSPDQQDKIIEGLSSGAILGAGEGRAFFELLLQNTREGFFADPVYGGNRDLVAWKMIGFPGARYDFRDWVERHGERYPLPPVGIGGRAEWQPGKT